MIRVLVADDHAIVREGLKQILVKSGDLTVAGEAANGNDALRMVREQEWDVLVTDMSMPGRNGLELIKLVKAARPALPVLVLSMYGEEQFAVRAIRAGAHGRAAAGGRAARAGWSRVAGRSWRRAGVSSPPTRGCEQRSPLTCLRCSKPAI